MFSFERMLKIWEKYGHMYWNGLGYTLLFAFVSVLMGLVLGLVLASGRMASVQSRDNLAVKALKAVAKFFCTAYVEVFRATPMLVQVFIIYYGLGNVFKLPDSSLNRMFWGMVGIVELMFRAQSIAKQTYIFLEPYVIAAIMYFIIVFPLSKIIAAVERRMSKSVTR